MGNLPHGECRVENKNDSSGISLFQKHSLKVQLIGAFGFKKALEMNLRAKQWKHYFLK